MAERLQKLLAQAGYGSRREIEGWIKEGLIVVNGKKATLGDKASLEDRIMLRGYHIKPKSRIQPVPRVLIYHKPVGQVSTRKDEKGRSTVFDHLPYLKQGRWIQVGRLDVNTDGLLLFTTDGELAHRLMHPSRGIERKYAARILGTVDDAIVQRLRQGVELDDGLARFEKVKAVGGTGANRWFHVTLREGRNREVRRLWESQGVRVSRLRRIAYGIVLLPRSVRSGHSMELPVKQVRDLCQSVDIDYVIPKAKETKTRFKRRSASSNVYANRSNRTKAHKGRTSKSTKPVKRKR